MPPYFAEVRKARPIFFHDGCGVGHRSAREFKLRQDALEFFFEKKMVVALPGIARNFERRMTEFFFDAAKPVGVDKKENRAHAFKDVV